MPLLNGKGDSIVAWALAVYCLIALVPLTSLVCTHGYLLGVDLTTAELIRRSRDGHVPRMSLSRCFRVPHRCALAACSPVSSR